MTIGQEKELRETIIANKAAELFPNDPIKAACFISGVVYALEGEFRTEYDAKLKEAEESKFKSKYIGSTKKELEERIVSLRNENSVGYNLTTQMCNEMEILDIQRAIQKGYYSENENSKPINHSA